MFGLGATELILLLVFAIIPGFLWIYALISVLKNDFINSSDKIVWFLVVFFLPLLGSLLYIFIGRNKTVQHGRG